MTFRETMTLYYEGEIPSLYDAPEPSDGLPTAEQFFDTCRELQSDWMGLIIDGGYDSTNEGLEVFWMLAFGHTYAAFPTLDSYYRWEGKDEKRPMEKARQIENHFYEREHIKYMLNNKYGEE